MKNLQQAVEREVRRTHLVIARQIDMILSPSSPQWMRSQLSTISCSECDEFASEEHRTHTFHRSDATLSRGEKTSEDL